MNKIKEINQTTVRVYNRDDIDYKEIFREKEIVVPASGYIEMQRRKAVRFLQAFPGNNTGGNPIEKRLYMKEFSNDIQAQLDIEKKKSNKKFACPSCTFKTGNQEELKKHVESCVG